MSTIVGPFTVEDDNILGEVQTAAAAIPASIAGVDAPGVHHVWTSKRFGAPAWAYGYTPNRANSWCNPAYHVVAHEYAHGWWYRHGGSIGGAALRALVDHPELLGKVESQHYTNRLSEAYAHAFAAAVGDPDGVHDSFFRVKIPPSNFGALLDLMSKALAEAARPTHTYRRSSRVALRQLPQVNSPALDWAVSGDEIRSVDGLSGGSYAIRAPGSTDGLPSRLWLTVVALRGQLLPAPLYTAALAWAPIPAEPAQAAPPPPPQPS